LYESLKEVEFQNFYMSKIVFMYERRMGHFLWGRWKSPEKATDTFTRIRGKRLSKPNTKKNLYYFQQINISKYSILI